MSTCPSQASRLLTALLTMPSKQMWPYVNIFMKYLRSTLDDSVPLYIQGNHCCSNFPSVSTIWMLKFLLFFTELYKKVWLRFNSVLPRSLWVMTIKALLHEEATLPSVPPKQEKIIIDPLQILRCDYRVFRLTPSSLSIFRCFFLLEIYSFKQISRLILPSDWILSFGKIWILDTVKP